jgi:uncharacterized protein
MATNNRTRPVFPGPAGPPRTPGFRATTGRLFLAAGFGRATPESVMGLGRRQDPNSPPFDEFFVVNPPIFVWYLPHKPPLFDGSRYHDHVRDDEIRRILTQANPWWQAAAQGGDSTAWQTAHPLMRDRAALDLGYRSDVLDDIAAHQISDELVVLTGPRRVGKSIVLLDLAAALCGRPDLDPRQVLSVPCDGFAARDLRRVLTLGREMTRVLDAADVPTPRVWLFDEITSISGWTTVLKAARDGTPLRYDTVIATGSRWSANDDVEGNLMTGRSGTHPSRRIRHVLPMSFRSFLAATRPELARPGPTHPAMLQSADVAAQLEVFRFAVDDYDLAWQDYLSCGGFPRAVAERRRRGDVSDAYLRDLAGWLRSDVDRDAPPESIPLLLEGLVRRSTSPLSMREAAADLGYKSEAFQLRLRRLVSGFAALMIHQYDDEGRRVPGSQSKMYLTDPLLAWLPNRLRAGCAVPDMTALTEACIGVALARAIDHLDEGRWASGDTIGYVRTGSGNEVDLGPVNVPSPAGAQSTAPLESKWVDANWRSEARVIDGKFGRGVVTTKSILDTTSDVWAVPAPIVALLLN